MSMTVNLHIYEALTEAGVKPDTARNVERALEANLHQLEESAVKASSAKLDAELTTLKSTLFTKADGAVLEGKIDTLEAKMESKIHEAINALTWRLIGAGATGLGLLFAALKLFH